MSIANNDSLSTMPPSGFESLAAELLLDIITRLPDLVTLNSFVRASPAAFRLFEDFGVEITEAILGSGFTCHHIQVIIRVVSLIRSCVLPVTSLADFKHYITDEAMYYREKKSSFTKYVPHRIRKRTTGAVLRSILETNRLIVSHAHTCLAEHLVRFKAVLSTDADSLPRVVGPPSWVEEQRVIRALWRLQMIHDLRCSAAQGKLMWPAADLEKLQVEDPISLFYHQTPTRSMSRPRYREEDLHFELDALLSIAEYVRGQRDRRMLFNRHADRDWLLPQRLEDFGVWPKPMPDEKERNALLAASPFSHTYSDVCHGHIQTPHRARSPFMCTQFRNYGSLGLAFWDTERLSRYGLVSLRESIYQIRCNASAWVPILSTIKTESVHKPGPGARPPYYYLKPEWPGWRHGRNLLNSPPYILNGIVIKDPYPPVGPGPRCLSGEPEVCADTSIQSN